VSLLEQWQACRREIGAKLAAGVIDAEEAAGLLAHLNYRIKRRPLILKRKMDRRTWRAAQAAHLRAANNR
jgi:hypothetical protein